MERSAFESHIKVLDNKIEFLQQELDHAVHCWNEVLKQNAQLENELREAKNERDELRTHIRKIENENQNLRIKVVNLEENEGNNKIHITII